MATVGPGKVIDGVKVSRALVEDKKKQETAKKSIFQRLKDAVIPEAEAAEDDRVKEEEELDSEEFGSEESLGSQVSNLSAAGSTACDHPRLADVRDLEQDRSTCPRSEPKALGQQLFDA